MIYPNACPKNSKCENQYGGYKCACDHGYKTDGEKCFGKNLFLKYKLSNQSTQNELFMQGLG